MLVESLQDYDDLYNTPDGQNLSKKLWVATKITGVTSLGLATVDVLCYSKPKTYLKVLGRYAHFCIPMLGISTAFVMVTGISANIRNKDDMINSGLGGIAAGTVFGAWRRNAPIYGFLACLVFGATGMLKKHCVLNGWALMDKKDLKLQEGGIRSVRYDWTLTKHRPGNWIVGPADPK